MTVEISVILMKTMLMLKGLFLAPTEYKIHLWNSNKYNYEYYTLGTWNISTKLFLSTW